MFGLDISVMYRFVASFSTLKLGKCSLSIGDYFNFNIKYYLHQILTITQWWIAELHN